MTYASLPINFTPEDYSGLLFDVPSQTVYAGSLVEFDLHGVQAKIDEPWELWVDGETVGRGGHVSNWTYDSAGELVKGLVEQSVNLEEATSFQVDYPFSSIQYMEVVSRFLKMVDGKRVPAWRRGSSCTGANCNTWWARSGGSGIRFTGGYPLWGTVLVRYLQYKLKRQWTWTVPSGAYGRVYYDLYNLNDTITKARYSGYITLPELETSVATQQDVNIYLYNASTEAPVSGGAVYIDGLYKGATDDTGNLRVDGLWTGSHTFKATATDYTDTDEDDIDNEEINVQAV